MEHLVYSYSPPVEIYKPSLWISRFYVVVRLFSNSINLLAFYHECCSLIGYATHYLGDDS